MKTEERQKHLEIVKPLTEREITIETYLMVADMRNVVVTQKEFKLFKSVVFGAGTAMSTIAMTVMIKLGLK